MGSFVVADREHKKAFFAVPHVLRPSNDDNIHSCDVCFHDPINLIILSSTAGYAAG